MFGCGERRSWATLGFKLIQLPKVNDEGKAETMKRQHRTVKTLCLTIGTLIAATPPTVVHAQDRVVLDEIIVTAQKREENLQVVPLAISAISAAELEKRDIKSLGDLNAIAPNVAFRDNAGVTTISTVTIRGSVSGNPAIWVDPPVGLYLNGIYLGKSQGSVFDVIDIERVEVLRGPQGTLFGRNTEGGAINFVTRRPSGEFSGSAKLELGNYNRRVGRVQMDLPQWGVASTSFAVRKEVADGWAKNRLGPDLGDADKEAFRASMKLDIADNLVAVYDFDYSNLDQAPVPTSLYSLQGWNGGFPGTFGDYLGGAIEAAAAPYVRNKRPSHVAVAMAPGQKAPYEKARGRSHALTLEFDATPDDQIKYIGAYRTMDFGDNQNISGTPLTLIAVPGVPPSDAWGMLVNFDRITDYDQTSHELQWIATRSSVNWVVGLYSFEDDGATHGRQDMSLFGTPTVQSNYAAKTDAWAAFGQLDWHVSDAWTATFGYRYTWEKRKGWTERFKTLSFAGAPDTSVSCDNPPNFICHTGYSKSFSDTTPMVALAWAPTDDINVYARIAKGFKSGGFSSELSVPEVTRPYKPQTSVSKEIGVKTMLWDGRARLNAAVFHNKISDFQTTALVPATTQSYLSNAGEAIYKGFEVEFAVQLTDDWRVSGNYGYLDSKFSSYMDNALWKEPGVRYERTEVRPLIETGSNRLTPYAPRYTYSLQLEGTLVHFGWADLDLLLDYSFTDKVYLYAVNKNLNSMNAGGAYSKLDSVPSTKNLNLSLQLSDVAVGNGTMDFGFFVHNLTDEEEPTWGIDFGMMRTANWQQPRTYAFSAAYKW